MGLLPTKITISSWKPLRWMRNQKPEGKGQRAKGKGQRAKGKGENTNAFSRSFGMAGALFSRDRPSRHPEEKSKA
jgi:hypothetical protein